MMTVVITYETERRLQQQPLHIFQITPYTHGYSCVNPFINVQDLMSARALLYYKIYCMKTNEYNRCIHVYGPQ